MRLLVSLLILGGSLAMRPQYHPQCVVDSLEDYTDLCYKTFSANCETETANNGVRIETDEDCYNVVKTVCTEDTEVVNNEVCATYYDQQKVVAEIKTVAAVFEKNCVDEEICEAPASGYAPEIGYGAAPQCVKTYKHVCYKEPGLTPVVRKVEILLPFPGEKCVNYPILLPRISCTQIEERHCMKVPVVKEGLKISINKCGVTYQDDECQDRVIALPRQACPKKMTNIKNIYEYVEESGYGASG